MKLKSNTKDYQSIFIGQGYSSKVYKGIRKDQKIDCCNKSYQIINFTYFKFTKFAEKEDQQYYIIKSLKSYQEIILIQYMNSVVIEIQHLYQVILASQYNKLLIYLNKYQKNGIYKLSDFGLAIVKNEIQNIIKQFHCEISVYMAPETVQLNQYSEKSDIWSLGFVLYIMLFKELPFNLNYNLDFKTKQKQINEQTLPKQIKIILIGMLKIEPPKRLSIDSKLSYLLDQKKVQCNSDQNIFCQILRKSNSYANYHNSKHLSKTRPDELPQIDKQIVPNNIVDYKKLAQIRKQQIDFQKILI